MRKIVEIDEELCDGCGQCILSCAEGAIEIVDGKARIKAERYCDGLGACLGECPQGALKVIEREADPFDEEAVHAMLARDKARTEEAPAREPRHAPLGCGCPGSAMTTFAPRSGARKAAAAGGCACMGGPEPEGEAQDRPESELTHWPVQIRLVPPHAPFLKNADLLIAADCAPVACATFHSEFLRGRVVMIGCPKFDDAQEYVKKLADVFRQARPRSVTVLRMEVPCCSGLSAIVAEAARLAGTDTPVDNVVVTRQGETVRSPSGPLGSGLFPGRTHL
jgi:ferredoxin